MMMMNGQQQKQLRRRVDGMCLITAHKPKFITMIPAISRDQRSSAFFNERASTSSTTLMPIAGPEKVTDLFAQKRCVPYASSSRILLTWFGKTRALRARKADCTIAIAASRSGAALSSCLPRLMMLMVVVILTWAPSVCASAFGGHIGSSGNVRRPPPPPPRCKGPRRSAGPRTSYLSRQAGRGSVFVYPLLRNYGPVRHSAQHWQHANPGQ